MLRHMPTCPGVDLHETTGSRGDRMTRCRGCGRFALASEVGRQAPPTAETRPFADVSNFSPAQHVRKIPPSAYSPRNGDTWPTHRSKARQKRFNRLVATRLAGS